MMSLTGSGTQVCFEKEINGTKCVSSKQVASHFPVIPQIKYF